MQKVRFTQSGKIEIVDNNTAHSLVERGLAEVVLNREVKKSKDKMQKKYRNKGL